MSPNLVIGVIVAVCTTPASRLNWCGVTAQQQRRIISDELLIATKTNPGGSTLPGLAGCCLRHPKRQHYVVAQKHKLKWTTRTNIDMGN